MANALVHIELRDGEATKASLLALNEGRRLATLFGATLYAMVPCPQPPGYGDDDVVAVLSRHGADKVVLVTNPQLSTPALYATHSLALKSAYDQFPAQLVLLPSSAGGRDIGARLALDLDGYFVGDATLQISESDASFSREVFRRRLRGQQKVTDAGRPLVLTLAPDTRDPIEMGIDEAEVVVVQAPTHERPGIAVVAVEEFEGEQGLVLGGGAGLDAEGFALLAELATRLQAPRVASSKAIEAGLATANTRVGFDGHGVDARRYVAFGISGSDPHLAGLSAHTSVIAVNSDPEAPIFEVAWRGLVADAKQTLSELLALLDPPAKQGDAKQGDAEQGNAEQGDAAAEGD